MKNTLNDLNNYLFAQMERLNEEDLSEEKLETEVKRTKAMVSVASAIVGNANLALQAIKTKDSLQGADVKLPEMLEG
jgi:conserved domain protein